MHISIYDSVCPSDGQFVVMMYLYNMYNFI